jgi:ferredoxin-like protein FixX
VTGARVADPQRAAAVANALKPSGLVPRGWLIPERGAAPLLTSGKPAGAICLVGHAGGGFWPVFAGWRQKNPGIADPLDAWSKMVIEPVARMAGGQAVFPSDRPWHPFQAWATEAEGLRRSPLGMLIHPVYGLWHGYRGAILFEDVALDDLNPGDLAARPSSHPCDMCPDKPCLRGCPAGAFTSDGFAVDACRAHLGSDAGLQGCMDSGCMARDACPVGTEYRYPADQIRFHMVAFF